MHAWVHVLSSLLIPLIDWFILILIACPRIVVTVEDLAIPFTRRYSR